jgi:hypothetical protein
MDLSPDSGLSVTVFFSDGNRTTYALSTTATGSTLISQIRSDPTLSRYADHTLLLLFLGHIISPEQVISSLSSSSELSVQCFARAPRPSTPVRSFNDDPVQGFDRLSRANYTPEQIARLRSVFHSVNYSANLPDVDRFALEDEWVPAITLAGSPVAAIRVIQLMQDSPSNPRPIRTVQTVEPPRDFSNEAESPLLQPDAQPPGTVPDSSWLPFILGVLIGMLFGKEVVFSVPFFMCSFPLFAVGLAFGGMFMVVLKLV